MGVFQSEFVAAERKRAISKQAQLDLQHDKMTALAAVLNQDQNFFSIKGLSFKHSLTGLTFNVTSLHALDVSVNTATKEYIVSEPMNSNLLNTADVDVVVKFLARYSEEMFSQKEAAS